jgi:hypothetical protein
MQNVQMKIALTKLNTGLCCALLLGPAAAIQAEEQILLWDDSVQGDLSNDFTAPTMFEITEAGEYLMRVETGPIVPVRREGRATQAGGSRRPLRGDANGDGRITRDESGGAGLSVGANFDIYDIDGDGAITAEERAQFRLGGDFHDLFDFKMGPGINLIGVKFVSYDSGGPKNEGTPLTVIDTRADASPGAPPTVQNGGRFFEAAGAGLSDLVDHGGPHNPKVVLVQVNPNPEGEGVTEVYDDYGLWRFYRRNDDSVFWRLGEGQEKATSEIIYVFSKYLDESELR